MERYTVRRAGGRPESQWLRSDERRGQAYWRRSDRSKRRPFRLVDYPRSSLTPLSPFSLQLSLSLSLSLSRFALRFVKYEMKMVFRLLCLAHHSHNTPKLRQSNERTTLFCFWFFFFINNIWFFLPCGWLKGWKKL